MPGSRQEFSGQSLFLSLQQKRTDFERQKIAVQDEGERDHRMNERNTGKALSAVENQTADNGKHDADPDHRLGHFVRAGRGLGPI